MLICGKPSERANAVGAADFGRAMRAAVDLEDVVVEVLDAEAEARHAHLADRRELRFGQRARFTLEGDFFRRRPRRQRREPLHQSAELRRRQERRRAAAEIDEIELAAGNRGKLRVEFPLAREQVEIAVDLFGVLAGVDPEIAEVAAFPAERDVQVEAERRAGHGRRLLRGNGVVLDAVARPDRKRRIVGDEIAANFRLVRHGGPGILGHRQATISGAFEPGYRGA